MVTHMKTTIEISDPLLAEARKVAKADGLTLRTLVEEGLRRELKGRRSRSFRMRRVTFSGNGLQPAVREGTWDGIRTLVYEGRGG